jgi:hypothetical protein
MQDEGQVPLLLPSGGPFRNYYRHQLVQHVWRILAFLINKIWSQEHFETTCGVHDVHTPTNHATCFKSESLDDRTRRLVLKEK